MDKTEAAKSIFNRYAQVYQDKYMDISRYHDTLDHFCESIRNPDANILDIACGPGNITQYILQKRSGYKVLGLDIAPNMIQLAKKNNPTAEFQLLDARLIAQLTHQYNGIICGFGLPYISKEDATQMIKDAASLLLPDGVLYLSTMEGDYEQSAWKSPSSGKNEAAYTYYYSIDLLDVILKESGFTLLKFWRKAYSDEKGNEVVDLVLISKLSKE